MSFTSYDQPRNAKVFTVRIPNRNYLFVIMFNMLLQEGHFGVSSEQFYSSAKPVKENVMALPTMTGRNAEIMSALKDLIDKITVPVGDEQQVRSQLDATSPGLQAAFGRLESLIPGTPRKLFELIESDTSLGMAIWPESMIIQMFESEGCHYVGKKTIFDGENPLGMEYTFTQPTGLEPREAEEASRIERALALYNQANQLGREGQFEVAIKHYQESLKINPHLPSTYNNLAAAYKRLGRLDEAEATYHLALEVAPAYYQAHFRLACLMILKGCPDAARQSLVAYFNAGGTLAEAETMLDGLMEAQTVRKLIKQIKR